MSQAKSVRCPMCRAQVLVEERDTHGDQVNCDNCTNALKVVRKEGTVRLVVADVGPLRDELHALQQRISGHELELRTARASLGIGANGLGLGVLYALVKVAWEQAPLTQDVILTATAIAVASGVVLELVNYLFLAKRQAMSRLSAEIASAQKDVRRLRQLIRSSRA